MLQIIVLFIGVYLIIGLLLAKVLLDRLDKSIQRFEAGEGVQPQESKWVLSTERLVNKMGTIRFIMYIYMACMFLWFPVLFFRNGLKVKL